MASVQFDGGKHTTKQAASGHIPHDFRERDNYGNEDIDKSRTFLNQKFGCQTGDEARKKLRDRIAECDKTHPPKRIKADRKTSIEIHIPSPREDLDDEKQREFFEKAYAELEVLFGKDNVIYGVTHFDEVHEYYDPHDKQNHNSRAGMHVVIIPFTDEMSFVPDKYKSGLNMNNFYRRNLPTIVNKKLDEVCHEVFGFNYQDGSKTSNKETVEELKASSKKITKQKKSIEHNKSVLEKQKNKYESVQANIALKEQALKADRESFEEERTKWYMEQKESLETEYTRKEEALNKSMQEYKMSLIKRFKEILAKALKEQVKDVKRFRQWFQNERGKQVDEFLYDSDDSLQKELSK